MARSKRVSLALSIADTIVLQTLIEQIHREKLVGKSPCDIKCNVLDIEGTLLILLDGYPTLVPSSEAYR